MNDYLLDRFLFFNFKPEKNRNGREDVHDVIWQIIHGAARERAGYFNEFNDSARDIAEFQWEQMCNDATRQRILEAILWTYAITVSNPLNNETNVNQTDANPLDAQQRLKQLFELTSVSINPFTSSQYYANNFQQSENVLKYIYECMGLIQTSITNNDDGCQVIQDLTNSVHLDETHPEFTFVNLENIYKGVIHRTRTPSNTNNIMYTLRRCRNFVTHRGPKTAQYWERLKYLLYDIIMFVYYLRESIDERAVRQLPVYVNAKQKIDALVERSRSMTLHFIYETGSFDDLRIDGGISTGTPEEENGRTIKLERRIREYMVRTFQNGRENVPISFKTKDFYDGAKIAVTQEPLVPYPKLSVLVEDNSWFITDGAFREYILRNIRALGLCDSMNSYISVLMGLEGGNRKDVIEHLNRLIAGAQQYQNQHPQDEEVTKKYLDSTIKGFFEEIREVTTQTYKSVEEAMEAEGNAMMNLISQLNDRVQSVENEVERLKQEMAELRTEVNERIETCHADVEGIKAEVEDVKTDVDGIKTDVKEVKTISFRTRRMKYAMVAAGVVIALLIAAFAIGRINPKNLCAHYEWTASLSHFCGNRDIAYDYAVAQETAGNYVTAATWYRKAIKRYTSLVDENPEGECDRALRLTFMYMRGKGGSVDRKFACRYAKIAKRLDICAYILASEGDYDEAAKVITYSDYKSSDYMDLANALIYLSKPFDDLESDKVDCTLENVEYLIESTNEIAEEAMLTAFEFYRSGIYVEEPLRGYLIPSFARSNYLLFVCNQKFNSLRAQLLLAKDSYRVKEFEVAAEFFDKAYKNGNRTVLMGMYLELLENITGESYRNSLGYFNDLKDLCAHQEDKDIYEVVCAGNRMLKYGEVDAKLKYNLFVAADSMAIQNELSESTGIGKLNTLISSKDITVPSQLYPYISDDFKDQKESIANYYMGAINCYRYWENGDTLLYYKGLEYLELSAMAGMTEAVRMKDAVEGIVQMKKLFSNAENLSLEQFKKSSNELKKTIDRIRVNAFDKDFSKKIETANLNDLADYIFQNPNDFETIKLFLEKVRWRNISPSTVDKLCAFLEIMISKYLYWGKCDASLLGYTFGCLAQFELLKTEGSNSNVYFNYMELAETLTNRTCQMSDTYFCISEIYRKANNVVLAREAMEKCIRSIHSSSDGVWVSPESYNALYLHCKQPIYSSLLPLFHKDWIEEDGVAKIFTGPIEILFREFTLSINGDYLK